MRFVYLAIPLLALQELRQQRIDDHYQLARRSSFESGVSDLWGPWEPEGLVVK
jgi:hypothetical protein